MSSVYILDGKPVYFGDISCAIESLDQTFQNQDEYFSWEHPERYIEIKKFLYAYGGKHPVKELFIEMEGEGFKVSYKSSIKKQIRLATSKSNCEYYQKQTKYINDKDENKLFLYEKCCNLLEVYMKLVTKDSIDRNAWKNNHEQYPRIYTENKLKLIKEAEVAFNDCLDFWGIPETMDNYMVDPYNNFFSLGEVIVENLTDELKKVLRKVRRSEKKRKKIQLAQQERDDLAKRIQKYKEEAKVDKLLDSGGQHKDYFIEQQQNVEKNKNDDFSDEKEFNAGF